MISILRNEVERLRPAHDELAAQMAEFLAAGGEIEEIKPPPPPKPVVYVPQEPPAPKPFVRRRVEATPLPIEPIDARADRRAKQAEQAKALAATHTQTEACFALGMTSKTIKSLAKEFGFTFKRSTHGGYNGPERKRKFRSETPNSPSASRHSRSLASHVEWFAESLQYPTGRWSAFLASTASTIRNQLADSARAPHSPHPATQTSNMARTASQRNRRGRPWLQLNSSDLRRAQLNARSAERRTSGFACARARKTGSCSDGVTQDTEQGSVMAGCLRHVHSLGREGAIEALRSRHKIEVNENVAAELYAIGQRQASRLDAEEA